MSILVNQFYNQQGNFNYTLTLVESNLNDKYSTLDLTSNQTPINNLGKKIGVFNALELATTESEISIS